NSYQYMGMNLHHPILSDVRVRRAITHALDRWAMVENLFDGMAIVQTSHMSSVSWAYDPTIKPLPFDQEKAAQLLDEAGWKLGKDGFRYYHPEGK
ncbi:MAG TPA: ABC transporter substrate-binding protein, partial [Bacillota bacterium]|nr:ABC transporter substrate-binding protein [Bacillota bacterium]